MASSIQLKKTLGLRFVIVFAVANIIGSGVYKKVAPMAGQLHSSGWILIAWVLGGIISLFGALTYAEVAGLLADTGGDYAYYKKIYNKFFAFQFGWSTFTVIESAAIASLAYVFTQSLNSIIHLPPMLGSWSHIGLGDFLPFKDFNIKFVAIILIITLSWINTYGLKMGAWLGTFILLLVFTGIFIIVIFGLGSPVANTTMAFSLSKTGNVAVTFSTMFTAMLSAFYAYQGWAAVGYLGGEAKEANRNIPKGIAIGIFIVIGLYLLVNIAYLSLLPVGRLEVINGTNQIAAVEAVKTFWGRGGELFISILILITTLSCNHVTIIGTCRIYYAMAKEGLFFKAAGRLNRHAAPANSLIIQCIWSCLLVFSGSFDQLSDMLIFAVFIFYGATALGVFLLRKKMPDAARPYKVWGYPFVPAIVILFSVSLFANTIVTQPREALMGLALMLTGIPTYFYFMSKNKKIEGFLKS
ncbi:MAG TPA: amino acid permease [Chitinophagaceae bacterium]|nr:amino acid permease [Chitinophagaceae bacterium]